MRTLLFLIPDLLRLFQPEMAGFGSKISYKTEDYP